ncbi:helix-turn-helix domain-containing protein [Scytonema sp. PCC 10023]
MLKAIKIRLYPTTEQERALAKSFGCALQVLELCLKCLHSTL